MAVAKVKGDNINQAMQKAKSESVDAWTEYQAARIKLHVDENGLATLRLLETGGQIDKALAAKQTAEYETDIKKYQERSKETRAKAERLEAEYARLNYRDDQFDVSEAFLSIAIAIAAIAALIDIYWLLYVAWGRPWPLSAVMALPWASPVFSAFPCGRACWRRVCSLGT